MKKDQPRLELPTTRQQQLLFGLATACLILMFVVASLNYARLPEMIPIHFGVSGKPDNFGHKRWIWFIPGLSLLMHLGLTRLNRIPHTFNYPVQISENNAAVQYQLARTMMAGVNLVVMILMLVIVWATIQVATGGASRLALYLVVPALLMLIVPMIIYGRVAKRLA